MSVYLSFAILTIADGYYALCIATGMIKRVITSTQEIHQKLERLFQGKVEILATYLKALHATFSQAMSMDQYHCIAIGNCQ